MVDAKKTASGKAVQATALLQAVCINKMEAVSLLLEHKADPDLADSGGMTPLMMAAQDDHGTILDTLVHHKAAVNAVGDKYCYSAFHVTCLRSNAACAVALAKAGCDLTLRANNGETGKDIAERKDRSIGLDRGQRLLHHKAAIDAVGVLQLGPGQKSINLDNEN